MRRRKITRWQRPFPEAVIIERKWFRYVLKCVIVERSSAFAPLPTGERLGEHICHIP
jgi:hypothetical protein